MAEDSSIQEFPTYVQKSSSKGSLFVIVISILLLVVIAGGGYYFFAGGKHNLFNVSPLPEAKPTATPTVTVAASPSGVLTPTVDVSLERSNLRVAVLNGSGIPGAAKDISAELTDLGYTIATVGNADAYTYENITVKITKSKRAYQSLLEKDITKAMPDAVVTTEIDDKIETDAEVIVGK